MLESGDTQIEDPSAAIPDGGVEAPHGSTSTARIIPPDQDGISDAASTHPIPSPTMTTDLAGSQTAAQNQDGRLTPSAKTRASSRARVATTQGLDSRGAVAAASAGQPEVIAAVFDPANYVDQESFEDALVLHAKDSKRSGRAPLA